jgi:ABC-type multidrug transport system fused ATPase/permease subunit
VIWQAHGVAVAGTLYVFFDWMRRFFLPLRDLSQKYSVMQSSMASCERIFQLLDTVPAIRDPAPGAARALPARRRDGRRGSEVVFDDVWFAYLPGEWVLRGISFRVARGEKVALVGPTGAGKTSVINLLARLYEPQRGTIRIDGVDLREWPQAELHRRLAVVLQDVFLFSGSVAENIALGRAEISRDDVENAARAVHADRFVRALPAGYDTPVRERGSNFSGGERQLLSFARALAHGADLLVLDEATSSIDSATEALVQDGIHVLMRDVTAIAIAHRLSTIEDVDRIYVLERGRIVDSGKHAELLARGGLYGELHRLQSRAPRAELAAAGG